VRWETFQRVQERYGKTRQRQTIAWDEKMIRQMVEWVKVLDSREDVGGAKGWCRGENGGLATKLPLAFLG